MRKEILLPEGNGHASLPTRKVSVSRFNMKAKHRITRFALWLRAPLFILLISSNLLISSCRTDTTEMAVGGLIAAGVIVLAAAGGGGGGGGSKPPPVDPVPVIDTFSVTPTILYPGDTLDLSIQGHDLDAQGRNFTVTYRWTAKSSGNDIGTIGNATTDSTTWSSPATPVVSDTIVTITGTVIGSGGRSTLRSQNVTIKSVPAGTPPTANPTIVSPAPNPSGAYNIYSTLRVTANATDAEGDPITYQWTAAPDGEINDPQASEVLVSFKSIGAKTITLQVADKDGQNQYPLNIAAEVYFPGEPNDVIWMATERGADATKVVVTIWVYRVTDAFEVDCPIIFDETKLKTSPPPSLDSSVGSKANDPDGLWEDTRVDLSIGGFLPPNTYDIAIAGQGITAGNVAQGLKSGKAGKVTFSAVAGATGKVTFRFDTGPSPQGVSLTRYVNSAQQFVEFTGGVFGANYTLP